MSSAKIGGKLSDVERSLDGWQPRPAAARAVRAVQILLPFVGGWIAIRGLQPLFYEVSENRWVGFVAWLVQAMFVSALVSAVLVHLLRRLTPLVSLLNMSLVFPDSVPSRFGLALRTGTVKRLMAEPTLQLSNGTQAAAEEAVQLVSYLGKHDAQTRGHTERVRAYSDVIGQQMGLSQKDLNGLRWGALLHDVGKLTVPPEILNKPGNPTDEEWEILRGHPAAAVPILAPLEEWLGEWALAAPQHHEKWDGSGYPAGLQGNEISLAGRIAGVADAYDVITSRRSYKEAMSAEAARAEMVKSSGTHFDPKVVRALLEAGVTRSSYTRRLGWIMELPGVVSSVSTAGHAVAATAVAVVIASAATVTAAPSTGTAAEPSSALAFIEETETTDDPSDPANTVDQAATVDSQASVDVGTGIGRVAVDNPSLANPSVPSASVPNASQTASGDSQAGAPSSTTRAPAATAAPTTRAPATTAAPTTRAPATAAVPTTRAPAATAAPTTRAPATTAAPTTRAPATTAAPTTRAPATTAAPTTRAPATTAAPRANSTTAACRSAQSGETFLQGLDLRRCDLSSISGAGLDLFGADLAGADLSNVVLSDFNMTNVNLEGAILDGAQLTRGGATHSSFAGVSAQGLQVTDVDFSNSDLQGVDFRNSRISGTSFTQANISRANFRGATITASNFNSAEATGANFSGLNLSGIEFFAARLGQLNFASSNLTDAKFAGAVGTPTGLGSATFFQTTCPTGIVQSTSCWAQ